MGSLRYCSAADFAVINKTGSISSLSAGGYHNCVINKTDHEGLGYGICWGKNDHGQAEVPRSAGLLKWISAGFHHSCAINSAGLGLCWGRKSFYVNRTSIEAPISYPSQRANSWMQFMEAGVITEITAGFDHTCALREAEGQAICWGWGDDRVGVDGFQQARIPDSDPVYTTASGTYRKWSHVSAAHYHSCGVQQNQVGMCWGRNDYGQGTVPEMASAGNQNWPVGKLLTISAGMMHTCGIRVDGRGLCWGRNQLGQTNFPEDGLNKPYDLEELIAISTGSWHSCALRRDHRVECWGWNGYGQCTAPQGNIFVMVSVGAYHSCAATFSGVVQCWGRAEWNQNAVPAAVGQIAIRIGATPAAIEYDWRQPVPPVPARDTAWFV